MSLKLFTSGVLAAALLAAVVAPGASASHLSDPTACTCSASLSLNRPLIQWSGDGLVLIPQVDISIRAKGGSQAPPLNIFVNHEGSTEYESDDVTVPAGMNFAGQKQVLSDAACNGSYRYRYEGVELTPVTLSGLVRSLFGEDQELKGIGRIKASVVGCGFEEDDRGFSFKVREFGNLR